MSTSPGTGVSPSTGARMFDFAPLIGNSST